MSEVHLTTSQAAERLGAGKSTVNLWCRQGSFPNAYAREEERGHVWYIPESDLNGFTPPPMGRPPKQATVVSNSTSEVRRADNTAQKLNLAFRKATEDEQQAGKKKGKK